MREERLQVGSAANASDSAFEEAAYDYAGLAASAFDFDDEDASEKPWIREILGREQAVNTEAEEELKQRNDRKSTFEVHGPRTFVLTVGGPGTGKSFATGKVLGGETELGLALGPREDYVAVNPDDTREESPAFKEILRVAEAEGKKLPRNLVQDSNLKFLVGKSVRAASWVAVGREYTQGHLLGKVFDKKGRTGVVYDSVCGTVDFCKQLLQKAVKAGYQRLAVVSVDVDPDCAVYRAGELRAQQTGRTVPESYVRWARGAAGRNLPKLVEEARKLMPQSWVAVASSPKAGEALDEHRCPTASSYAMAGP